MYKLTPKKITQILTTLEEPLKQISFTALQTKDNDINDALDTLTNIYYDLTLKNQQLQDKRYNNEKE